MKLGKILLGSIAIAFASVALGSGTLRLSTFPSIAVADAGSSVSVTAEVRDSNGKPVPDGTQVVFEASTGTFRDTVVTTINGFARAGYVPGSLPGTAKITATAFAYNVTTSLELELVSDRSVLSTASEYIEVVAPQYLMYSMDQRVIAAAGPNKGVNVRYREIRIEADDVQINLPTYELRARKAHLKLGAFEGDFEELYLTLNKRRGYGTSAHEVPELTLVPMGRAFRMVDTGLERSRFGLVTVNSAGVQPFYEQTPARAFDFVEMNDSTTMIAAKKATAFPNKEIQFQKAEIYMGDARVMKLPLFQVNLVGGTPLLTDQIINVDNNQLSINYPHYLSLRPGQTSLLRFRTGGRYGSRGSGIDSGAYLDYELNWNKGDDSQGGLTVSSLARSDWGINARQYLKLDNKTTVFAQADMTALRSAYASGNVSRQFDGFQMNLNGSSHRTLRGLRYNTDQFSLVAEKDPTKFGRLPVRLYYGFVASNSTTDTAATSSSQTALGIRGRAQLLPLTIDRNSSFNASLAVSRLQGHNTSKGLTVQGAANLSYRLSREASLLMSYDYLDDVYSRSYSGKQRVSAQGSYFSGKANFSIFASKSLDSDRATYFVDSSYKFSNVWRMAYSYTYDRYVGELFSDYSIALIYTFGWRDFGLTYSARTKRVGIQVLGASFN